MVKPIHDSSYLIHFGLTNPLNHFNLYYDQIYHYRKHINFHGPKTHENKRKPTKKAIFVGMPTKIAAKNICDENVQLFSSVPT
jgi:hypothetical protein